MGLIILQDISSAYCGEVLEVGEAWRTFYRFHNLTEGWPLIVGRSKQHRMRRKSAKKEVWWEHALLWDIKRNMASNIGQSSKIVGK